MIGTIKPTFDATAIDYSLANAHYLALASHAAYAADAAAGHGAVAKAAAQAELGLSAAFEFGDPVQAVAGFVGLRADSAIVSFRGTFNVPGWMADANVVQEVYAGTYPGRVHRGFARGVEDVWKAACALIPSDGRPVWVTGHSLGAALATLAASRLLSECKLPVAGVYTYGSPRVGDLDFYNGYVPATYRHVNDRDVVPHVPLEEMMVVDTEAKLDPLHPWKVAQRFRFLRFKHVGTLRYFNRQGIIGDGASTWDEKKALVLETLSRLREPGVEAVDDHGILKYVAAIEKNLLLA